MAYRIGFHEKAEAELDKLYEDIALQAGLESLAIMSAGSSILSKA